MFEGNIECNKSVAVLMVSFISIAENLLVMVKQVHKGNKINLHDKNNNYNIEGSFLSWIVYRANKYLIIFKQLALWTITSHLWNSVFCCEMGCQKVFSCWRAFKNLWQALYGSFAWQGKGSGWMFDYPISKRGWQCPYVCSFTLIVQHPVEYHFVMHSDRVEELVTYYKTQ